MTTSNSKLNIKLIRESFDAIKPYADEVLSHFYQELFTRYPAAKGLFQGVDMKKQKGALAGGLIQVLSLLDQGDKLTNTLQKMGARHRGYGTQPEHYPWVGEALLATFEYYFAEQWTEELKQQWTMAYGVIAGEMIKGQALATEKVIEMKPVKKEPTIEEMTQDIVRELLKGALDQEIKNTFQAVVQEKAKELLKQSLEEEAKKYLELIRGESGKVRKSA